MHELSEYESVKNWTSGFSESTKRQYTRFIKLFCEFTDKDPDQLMAWVKQDKTKVHQKAKEFHRLIAEHGISCTSDPGFGYVAVRSFFVHNDYPLGIPPRAFMSRTKIRENRLLKPIEVHDMLTCTTRIRSKAIISLLAQSGQRVGLLSALRYGAIRRKIEQAVSPVVVEVNAGISNGRDPSRANKARTNYRFAFGKESRNYIIQMLNRRRHEGETIEDDSWLFRCAARTEPNLDGKWYPKKFGPGETGRALNPDWANMVVIKAAEAVGIQSEKFPNGVSNGITKRYHDVHAHILRSFWKHQMREGGVTDPDLLDFMMGHKVKRYGGAYDIFDAEHVRREYVKAEPSLTLMTHDSAMELRTPENFGWRAEGRDNRRGPQRIVRERELESFLGNGWLFVTTLPSKKIVIEQMQQ